MTSPQSIVIGVNSALLAQADIPGPIGALIISTVFPSDGVPSYFAEVYEQIKQIVNEAITDNDITLINASINGINDWVRESYAPSKADPKYDRVILNKDLETHADTFYNDIAVLRDLGTGTPGFSVFLLAAGAHLALLQECAITDPNHPDVDAWNSRFTGQILATLDDYIQYAETVWSKILSSRLASITVEHVSSSAAVGGNPDLWIYFAQDAFTGEQGDEHFLNTGPGLDPNPPDTRIADATADANVMKSRASDTLKEALGDPDTVINQWRILRGSPLPMASVASIVAVDADHRTGCIGGVQADVYTISWTTQAAESVQISPYSDTKLPASGKRSYIQSISPFVPVAQPWTIPATIAAYDAHAKAVQQNIVFTEKAWDPVSPLNSFTINPMDPEMQVFDWPS